MLLNVFLGLLLIFIILSIVFVIKSKFLKKRALQKLKGLDKEAESNWSEDFLERKRSLGDPLADQTVKLIMERGHKTEVNHIFELLKKDRGHLPDDAPEELKLYFEKSSKLPEWADKDLLALGQQVYLRHGFWISLLLNYKSLPECYACAHGAEVLHTTARLNEHHGAMEAYSRRIAETAQFVFFAMKPNGLNIKGKGLVATQKVRLIHAVIRYYITQQNWDSQLYGKPINQEDMAGTLMSFSALVLEGLFIIGIELEEVEKEAYIHCWRVIGYIVGLDEDLIPLNANDAHKLGHAILDHQIAKSPQGAALTQALLDFCNLKFSVLLKPRQSVALLRLMMGKEISDLLEVPYSEEKEIQTIERKLKRISSVGEFLDKSLVFAMVLQFFTAILSQLMITTMTKSKIVNFYIPKSLTRDWKT